MTHLHLEFDFWNFEHFEIILWISKNFKYQFFKIMSALYMWMVGYHHIKKLPIKIYLLKEFLT